MTRCLHPLFGGWLVPRVHACWPAGYINSFVARPGEDETIAREAPQVPLAVNVVAVARQRTGLRVEIPLASDLIKRRSGDMVNRVVAIQSRPLGLEHRV